MKDHLDDREIENYKGTRTDINTEKYTLNNLMISFQVPAT